MKKYIFCALLFCFYSCGENSDYKQRELDLKERELKLKEKELEGKSENKQTTTNNTQTTNLTIPNNPLQTIKRWVSKNYYGNGHNEYLFLVGMNTDAFYFVYYSTSQNNYIELKTRPIFDKPNIDADMTYFVNFPDNSSYELVEYRDGSLISKGNGSKQMFNKY